MKRLTLQEIEDIRKLSKKGLSSVKIGKKYGRGHSTILYHLGTLKRKPKRIREPLLPKIETPDFIKKNLAERKAERIKPKKGRCVICGGKIKDKKFILTNYCSLKCFKTKL